MGWLGEGGGRIDNSYYFVQLNLVLKYQLFACNTNICILKALIRVKPFCMILLSSLNPQYSITLISGIVIVTITNKNLRFESIKNVRNQVRYVTYNDSHLKFDKKWFAVVKLLSFRHITNGHLQQNKNYYPISINRLKIT